MRLLTQALDTAAPPPNPGTQVVPSSRALYGSLVRLVRRLETSSYLWFFRQSGLIHQVSDWDPGNPAPCVNTGEALCRSLVVWGTGPPAREAPNPGAHAHRAPCPRPAAHQTWAPRERESFTCSHTPIHPSKWPCPSPAQYKAGLGRTGNLVL